MIHYSLIMSYLWFANNLKNHREGACYCRFCTASFYDGLLQDYSAHGLDLQNEDHITLEIAIKANDILHRHFLHLKDSFENTALPKITAFENDSSVNFAGVLWDHIGYYLIRAPEIHPV